MHALCTCNVLCIIRLSSVFVLFFPPPSRGYATELLAKIPTDLLFFWDLTNNPFYFLVYPQQTLLNWGNLL